MYDVRGLFQFANRISRVLVCGLGLAAFSMSAYAFDPKWDMFRATLAGNTAKIAFASDGTVLAAARAGLAVGESGGSAAFTRGASLATKYGPVAFNVAQKVGSGTLARALGVVSGSAMGPVAVALFAAPYIAEWLRDANMQPDADGALHAVTFTSDSGYQYRACVGAVCSDWGASKSSAAGWYLNQSHMSADGWTLQGCEMAPGDGRCYAQRRGSSDQYVFLSVREWSGDGSYLDPVVLTPEQVEAKLNAYARGLEDAKKVLEELAASEVSPYVLKPTEPVTVSDGGQSEPKASTSTQTMPDGTEVKTEKNCHVIAKPKGSEVYVLEECGTTVTETAPDGTTETTTVEESDSGDDAAVEGEEKGFCDSLFGKLVCSELDKPDAEPIDKSTKTIAYSVESHFGGGACPADQVMTTHNGKSLKVWDWAASCDKINQFFRPLFLTLCAFTALMILAPAVKEA